MADPRFNLLPEAPSILCCSTSGWYVGLVLISKAWVAACSATIGPGFDVIDDVLHLGIRQIESG
jgi:hypothetical protein